MPPKSEIWAFLVHLRVHYQVLILSGGYLLGGLYVPALEPAPFLFMFFVVHVLLNGGVTAYNSYYDDDDGPIGGLEHPPKMAGWMLWAALVVQGLGLVAAILHSLLFAVLYGVTMILSALYSAPQFRWKGRPLLSLVAVGVGTGTNTFWMGYLAAGGPGIDLRMGLAGLGVATLLLSLYPVSQVFQIEEDQSRGDLTFAARFGLTGVRRFFLAAYSVGLVVTAGTLGLVDPTLGAVFFTLGAGGGIMNGRTLFRLQGVPDEYRQVMRLKYFASLSFVGFLTIVLFTRAS